MPRTGRGGADDARLKLGRPLPSPRTGPAITAVAVLGDSPIRSPHQPAGAPSEGRPRGTDPDSTSAHPPAARTSDPAVQRPDAAPLGTEVAAHKIRTTGLGTATTSAWRQMRDLPERRATCESRSGTRRLVMLPPAVLPARSAAVRRRCRDRASLYRHLCVPRPCRVGSPRWPWSSVPASVPGSRPP
jgi:hypothetical protein